MSTYQGPESREPDRGDRSEAPSEADVRHHRGEREVEEAQAAEAGQVSSLRG